MAVLIGRGLDLKSNFGKALKVCFPLIFPSFLYSVFRALFQSLPFAPLAQLVEHLTLNQGVPGAPEEGRKAGASGQIWPVGQAVKTSASHAGNGGSIPPRVTKRQ